MHICHAYNFTHINIFSKVGNNLFKENCTWYHSSLMIWVHKMHIQHGITQYWHQLLLDGQKERRETEHRSDRRVRIFCDALGNVEQSIWSNAKLYNVLQPDIEPSNWPNRDSPGMPTILNVCLLAFMIFTPKQPSPVCRRERQLSSNSSSANIT